MMKNKRRVICIAGFLLLMVLAALFPVLGCAETYMERVNKFIKMDKYKDGAYWDGNSRDLAYLGWGCNAYVRDFAHYCWPDSPTNFFYVGKYFEDPMEISSGDLIYIDGYTVEDGVTVHKEHWYVVIERTGYDELWTIEGNCDKHVRESRTSYKLTKLGDAQGIRVFRHGYHMPGYAPYVKWTSIGKKNLTFRVKSNGTSQLATFMGPYSAERGCPVVSNLTDGQTLTVSEAGTNEYGETWWRLPNGSFVYGGILEYIGSSSEIRSSVNEEIGFLVKPNGSIPLYENCVPFEYWVQPVQHVEDDYIPVYRKVTNSEGQVWYQMDNGHFMRAEVLEEIGAHIEYHLSTEVPFGGGRIETSGTVFHKREQVTIRAIADSGYVFRYWLSYSGGTFADSTSPTTTYTMPGCDDKIVAVFSLGDYLVNVTIIEGGGSVGYPNTAQLGQRVEINADPQEGFYFAGWQSSDIDLGSQAMNRTFTFTMPAHNVSFTASFEPLSRDVQEIWGPDSVEMTAGETKYIPIGTAPSWADDSDLIYTLDSSRYFEIREGNEIFCKFAEGTSTSTLTISAPSGVSTTVQLIGHTNVQDYDYLINGLPCNHSGTLDVYRVGQSVPYRAIYQLSNSYDPGYELVPEEDEQYFTLDPATHTMTFIKAMGPEFASIGMYLPAAGFHLGYQSILVTDDRKSMVLPAGTDVIGEEAFAGSAAEYFFLPEGVTSIGDNAFPAGSCVFLNTANLNSYGFRANGVWFIENGEQYNEAFAAAHDLYRARRGTALPETWGEWSEWSETPAEESDTRHVRTKTQYRSAPVTQQTSYTAWSAWNDWSLDAQSIPDANLKQEERRTVYPYYCFRCPTCGWQSPFWGNGKCTYGHNIASGDFQVNLYEITVPKSGCTLYGSNKYLCEYNGQNWFYWDDGTSPDLQTPKTQYRYRTRSVSHVPVTGAWSAWGDEPVGATDSLAVETRVLYSWQDRIW